MPLPSFTKPSILAAGKRGLNKKLLLKRNITQNLAALQNPEHYKAVSSTGLNPVSWQLISHSFLQTLGSLARGLTCLSASRHSAKYLPDLSATSSASAQNSVVWAPSSGVYENSGKCENIYYDRLFVICMHIDRQKDKQTDTHMYRHTTLTH